MKHDPGDQVHVHSDNRALGQQYEAVLLESNKIDKRQVPQAEQLAVDFMVKHRFSLLLQEAHTG